MPHRSCDLRKGRISIPEQIYLITTVTQNRQPIFTDFHCARTVIHSLKHTEQLHRATSLSFIVMPDHLHWLLSLQDKYTLPQVISNIKRRSAYRINQHLNKTGSPVWQHGFHDYALREEDEIKDVARYIVANPLRAGLVDKIGDYPFWDAVWL
ncbi:MAG: transposase [Gammaproteobacteria bacterium]|nr:transposase [Gammaproteobacteria bacterium]